MTQPILLVEDSHHDVVLARRAFARAGVNAPLTVVMDGEAAILYLSGQEPFNDRDQHPLPSLVLLDLELPRHGGHEILSWLRQVPELSKEHLPVVILTTSDEDRDREKAAQAGASGYRTKPLHAEALTEILHTVGLSGLITDRELATIP